MTVASADINMQIKHNVICHVTKVKPATSAHSMADVIPFFSVFNIRFESNASIKPKENILLYTIKKTISATFSVHSCFNSFWRINITGCVIQSRSRFGRVEVCVWSPTKKKITRSCYSNLKPRLYFWLINSFLSQKSRLNLTCLQ